MLVAINYCAFGVYRQEFTEYMQTLLVRFSKQSLAEQKGLAYENAVGGGG